MTTKNELREESEHGVVVTKTSTNLLGGLRVEQIQLKMPLISNLKIQNVVARK
jgi:hypothetical protein